MASYTLVRWELVTALQSSLVFWELSNEPDPADEVNTMHRLQLRAYKVCMLGAFVYKSGSRLQYSASDSVQEACPTDIGDLDMSAKAGEEAPGYFSH